MNIEELLETIKDTSRDYVGMNGCLYQDIAREELDLIATEYNELQEKINKAIKKLSSAVNHFHTQRENNVITFTLKILKGSDTNE